MKITTTPSDALAARAAELLRRELARQAALHTRAPAVLDGSALAVDLRCDVHLKPEAFRLERPSDTAARIVGGSSTGILYGCGQFARDCRFAGGSPRLAAARAASAPEKSFRGMYFAIHNYNWYQNAPLEEVCAYIEDLALWGINNLALVFHMFFFSGIRDPEAQAFIGRMQRLFAAARAVGMNTTLLVQVNDAYSTSPETLRYEGAVPRNWGTELCPSKPEGRRLLLQQAEELFAQFDHLDYVVLWPYDGGGCRCAGCHPWGARGFLTISNDWARLFRQRFPSGKVILSAWYFDYEQGDLGEWDALYDQLETGLDWVDLVMADGAFVNGYFPRRLLERKLARPVVSFPEISMRTGAPWGGFGANPMPAFLHTQFALERSVVEGGAPYSEGLYEDLNKVFWAQWCWDGSRRPEAMVEAYAASEFSRDHAPAIAQALAWLEQAGVHGCAGKPVERMTAEHLEHAEAAWDSLAYLERALTPYARRAWRWRQVLLRARIDAELQAHGGVATPALGRALDELFQLYRCDDRTLWPLLPLHVVPVGDPAARTLAFIQEGKSMMDFACYRQTHGPDGKPRPRRHHAAE